MSAVIVENGVRVRRTWGLGYPWFGLGFAPFSGEIALNTQPRWYSTKKDAITGSLHRFGRGRFVIGKVGQTDHIEERPRGPD